MNPKIPLKRDIVPSAIPQELRSRDNVDGSVPLVHQQQKLMSAKSFRGNISQWEEYLIYWECVVKWNRWEDDKATDALMFALDGDSAVHVHSPPNFRTLTKLEDRFGAARTVTEHKCLLCNQSKEPGESYEHLVQDII